MPEFFTIVILHFFAVASPGPDFVLITRQCFKYGRRSAIWTSLGISIGILVHIFLSLIGLAIIINLQSVLFDWLKIVAAFYLSYLGISSLITKRSFNFGNSNPFSEITLLKNVITGFLTNVLNPKAFIFFITVFTIVISDKTENNIQIFYGFYMSFATFLWFSFLSHIFTNKKLITTYQSFLPRLERITGFLLVIIAIQILFYELPEINV